jgi:uroporphyrinogen-III synthase
MRAVDDTWHVLVTGPVAGLDEWVAAVGGAGWRATPFPLVRVEATGEPLLIEGAPLPTWVALTSSNAVAPLAAAVESHPPLGQVDLCCVGEATARRAMDAGLRQPVLPAPGAQDAVGLARTLIEHTEPGMRVLWPRGDRAQGFGAELEAAGLLVDAPVVYRTFAQKLESEPPDCDAVFFASPSAVAAWRPEERAAAPAAIAIGWTTYEALEPVAHRFSMVLPLATPSPRSLQECLRSFFPSE